MIDLEVTSEEEEEIIASKTEFEQSFIRRFRDVFSESLGPSRYVLAEPMCIKLREFRESWQSNLYCHRPRPIQHNIRAESR